jgi:HSP20 family protein
VLTRLSDRGRERRQWADLDDVVSTFDQLRSFVDRAFDEGGLRVEPGRGISFSANSWPRTNLADTGSTLVLTAEVPGLSDKDIQITLNQGVLTISGERQIKVPEGYVAYRQERGAVKFSRSFTLPSRVDAERAAATVKNGVLTVTLEKVPEAVPRQIAVTG